jgi:hypothetical protein
LLMALLLFGVALADVPQIATILFGADASGLSLTSLSARLFAVACLSVLQRDGAAPWPLVPASALLLLESAVLLACVSLFNLPSAAWPKASALLLVLTVACCALLSSDGIASDAGTVAPWMAAAVPVLRIAVAQAASACCLVAPVFAWYRNYRAKATRRISKVSQLLHTLCAAAGAAMQLSAGAALLSGPVLGACWHAMLHAAMFAQVLASDRAAATRDHAKRD